MDLVDWIILGALAVFAWSGWRQGFVAGAFSFLGFLAGGAAGLWLAPQVTGSLSGMIQVAAFVGVVVVSAVIGQVALSIVGNRLRSIITWTPVAFVDKAGGAALNVAAFTVMLWVLVSALAFVPIAAVQDRLQSSVILTTVDTAIPEQAREVLADAAATIGANAVPRIIGFDFGGDDEETDPVTDSVPQEVVSAIRGSVVRVVGDASACDSIVTGSGFIVADGLIATNAHVVAGTKDLRVRVRAGIGSVSGSVVYFDPVTDIALVFAPGLDGPALPLTFDEPARGEQVTLAGFPGGGRFVAIPGTMRGLALGSGEDIYGGSGSAREILVVRGEVAPGLSGGPVVLADGSVVGMVFASGLNGKSTGFAVPARDVSDALETIGDQREQVPTGSCEVRAA